MNNIIVAICAILGLLALGIFTGISIHMMAQDGREDEKNNIKRHIFRGN